MTYTCDDGYYFTHDDPPTTTAEITCDSTEQWSTLDLQCTGESASYAFYFLTTPIIFTKSTFV